MIRSTLCDCSDAYIIVKGTITIIFKNCAPFTDCISETNNKKIDHAKDTRGLIPMYNLTKYIDN